MFTMPFRNRRAGRGIVNVKMVITEEKILSNIEKVQRLINPNSKKQIIELEDNSYFKDLVESIKTYLIEYPKKKNFPKDIYDAAYELIEYATNQFEENTKQIEELIKQREYNTKTATILKQSLAIVQAKDENWKRTIASISNRVSEDIIQALNIIGDSQDPNSEEDQAAVRLINARIANLESNLHIEIDMERVEDRSKALSYIGIEIADALKLIPAPVENKKEKVIVPAENISAKEQKVVNQAPVQQNQVHETTIVVDKPEANKKETAYQEYYADTRREVRESLWTKIKNSKFVQAIKYALKIKVVLQLPEGLPEGRGENK